MSQLRSHIITLPYSEGDDILELAESCIRSLQEDGTICLRWGLVGIARTAAYLEVACLSPGIREAPEAYPGKFTGGRTALSAAVIIPTGVGAAMGGFIADCSPFVRVLSKIANTVIIHPNIPNGADFYGGGDALYVDGYTLDRFLLGETQLASVANPKIGLLLDKLEPAEEARLLNAANAMRAIYGADIAGYCVCREKLRVNSRRSELGHFLGEIENPEILLEAAIRLAKLGVQAIAIATAVSGITDADWLGHYQSGQPNPIGSAEALISRYVTYQTGLPAAHAPAFGETSFARDIVVDPRAAGEVASGTGLPCVIRGLMNTVRCCNDGGLRIDELDTITIPFGCAGGVPAVSSNRFGAKLIAVRSNTCAVGVDADKIVAKHLVAVRSYAEAVAYHVSLQANVSWDVLAGPVGTLSQT